MTTGHAKHKRVKNRRTRALKPPKRKPAIIGDDFKAVLDECKELLRIALLPAAGGRPQKSFTSEPLTPRDSE